MCFFWLRIVHAGQYSGTKVLGLTIVRPNAGGSHARTSPKFGWNRGGVAVFSRKPAINISETVQDRTTLLSVLSSEVNYVVQRTQDYCVNIRYN